MTVRQVLDMRLVCLGIESHQNAQIIVHRMEEHVPAFIGCEAVPIERLLLVGSEYGPHEQSERRCHQEDASGPENHHLLASLSNLPSANNEAPGALYQNCNYISKYLTEPLRQSANSV